MKSKIIIVGGESGTVKSILMALDGVACDEIDCVTISRDEDSLYRELHDERTACIGHVEEFAMKLGAPSEYVFGESICDPLQDAILSTEMACERAKDGNDVTLKILQKHLMNLHALQIEMLREKPEMMIEAVPERLDLFLVSPVGHNREALADLIDGEVKLGSTLVFSRVHSS